MKTMKYNTFAGYVKLLLDILFFLGIGCLIVSPLLINNGIYIYTSKATEYLIRNIFTLLVLSDIVIIYVLYELRKIFYSIKVGTPFIESNVKGLLRMGIASILLSFVFVYKLFVFKSFLTYFVILVLIIAGCFSFTLSELFKEAMRVKEENDLTI